MTRLKFALRTLFKTPFVTSIAVVSLALGIGANAAIFSLFDQLLLKALPVHAPEELVNLGAPGPKQGSTQCNQSGDCDMVFSYPMFRDLQKMQTSFTGIAAHWVFSANLAYRGRTLNGGGSLVSGSYFPVLGVRPAIGRLLTPDDDKNIGNHFVTVLSYDYWRTHLGADPNVLNDTLVVNGQAMTIVGVAPAGFTGTTLGAQPNVFVPLTMRRLMAPRFDDFENRRAYWAYLFARLKPGVSLEQARTALNVPYKAILNDVEAPLQRGMSDQTMKRFRARELTMEPGVKGQSSLDEDARTPLTLLLSITGIVLLIACANIANLLLARGAGRANEMAVRLSLGASRRQLFGQLLTESCLLALIGGVFGLLVAKWTLDLIVSILPPQEAITMDLRLQPSVLWFTAALSIGTGVLFGLFPALQSTRPDLATTLKGQAGQPSGNRAAARFRATLVTAQIALSMALLVSAGLFIKSLWNISRIDLGIKPDQLLTFGISPELNGYKPERARELFQRVEDEIAAVPGVTGVTASLVPILAGSNWGSSVYVQDFKYGPDTDRGSRFNEIGPAYFKTLGIPLISGREFTRADSLTAPKVVVVNEAFAKKFNLGRDAVGKRIGQKEAEKLDTEIVGLVQNAKYSEVKQQIPPLFFRPYRQNEEVGAMTFYVRTSLAPESLLTTISGVVKRLDPNLPIENLKTMPQQVRENVFLDRMIGTLSASFATLATLLAAVGLYGVLAYTVAQRTREIGLRMALGADGGRVRRMVLSQVGRLTAIGTAVGIGAGLALGRTLKSTPLLYELEGADPIVVASAAVVLVLVALTAGFVPAHRASRVHPMQALRYE